MAFELPYNLDIFPHPLLSDEDGFLAVGFEMSPSKILLAYQFGIFPWYNEGDPVLWWFTKPRFVLFPDNLIIQKSMRSYLNNNKFTWSMDTCFEKVINACQRISRQGQAGTWISSDLKEAFLYLHKEGIAHSVEVWNGSKLVGGLYGLSLGKVFYGESMFAFESNASKFGFIKLVHWLKENGFQLIDCQQETGHLKSLGAQLIPGQTFYKLLRKNIFNSTHFGPWQK